MRPTCWLIAALSLTGVSSAHAQRRLRIGPTYSSLGLDDASGSSHGFSGFGGTLALLTGDDGEAAVAVTRYNDLATDNRGRRLTLYALDPHYYPVGTRGAIPPFGTTPLGPARAAGSSALSWLL